MSWQDDAMIEQEQADALFGMGEAEWRDTFQEAMMKAREDQEKTLRKCKRSEYNAKYWQEHKKAISKRRKEEYPKNRDKILARNKKWLKDNKDKWNAYQRERRAKLKLDKKGKA